MPRPQVSLPVFYYLDHFHEMIAYAETVCAALIGPQERAFIADFRDLGVDAQCLYVRMINRKKTSFRAADLAYAEITAPQAGLAALSQAGFARRPDARDYRAVLADLSKPDLIALARAHDLQVRSAWAKPQLVGFLFDNLPYARFAADQADQATPDRRETVDYLLYLQFGHPGERMTRFALRDIGVAPAAPRASHAPRFASEAEARAGFFYSRMLEAARHGAETGPDARDPDAWPEPVGQAAQSQRDQLLFRLGQAAERDKDVERALSLYRRADAFDCRERRVRLLSAGGRRAEAETLIEQMLQSPEHDEEYIFAADFSARKFGRKRTGVFTDLLRQAETITVDELYRGDAEYAAMQAFARAGWRAAHGENSLWIALFALIFWDELFEAEGAMASDFDWLPQALRDNSFSARFGHAIEARLAEVRSGRAAVLVQAALTRRQGVANGLFVWFDGLPDMALDVARAAPPAALAQLLRAMAADFRGLRDGFPDLALVRGDELRLVEVKGEGDQIRRHQLARLNMLRGFGFRADVLRVAYRVDPDQTYVVVDVETTGGRPPNDRVTEIGAVKVRRGETIAEWSSLINPQKHIPAFITELTGISDAMVADAPVFADIADEFAAFIDGAVFVAHNAGFDHGFIASEFRRIGRRFRHPKLCTVSSMRRWRPGLPSYSLANLCRQYAIPLEQHHRALADARAAAALLNLVNEKRLARQ